MKIIAGSIQRFSSLNVQALANKNKNSTRFQSQNLNWDYQVVEYHCRAFAKGLKGANFREQDNFLIRIPSSQQAEGFVAKVGTAYINSNLIISKANSIGQLDQQISENNIKGFIFQPTLLLGQKLLIDSLYELMPETKNLIQGSQLSVSKYSSLKMLIQTNFYTYPGVFKYKSIFNYASDQFTPFSEKSIHVPLNIPDSKRPLVITQPSHDFAFRAGILNSLIHGRYVICVEPNEVSKITQVYNNQIDLIATEECPINEKNNIYVEKGSNLFSSHPNKKQI